MKVIEELVLDRPSSGEGPVRLPSAVVGTLIAMADDGRTPLVVFPDQPGTAAIRARSIVDLVDVQIGRPVVLTFEAGDPARPIVMGVIRQDGDSTAAAGAGHVTVDADGQRMIVAAKEQLVLRCGKASVTLTRAGKVLVQGTYVSSRSTGVNRIKGGSIQLN
jgi:hypothetical protein